MNRLKIDYYQIIIYPDLNEEKVKTINVKMLKVQNICWRNYLKN